MAELTEVERESLTNALASNGGCWDFEECCWRSFEALTPTVEAILTDRLARVEALVSDWQANGNSRELGDPTDRVWFTCAEQLLAALAGEPEGSR